jgi:hypothetical protein
MSVDLNNVNKVAHKLHKQFGHPTPVKLIALLKNAGVLNKALETAVNSVCSSCDVCARFKKAKPRPIVSLPLADKFNETIAMDLKSWGKVYFLVIIDHATRYCNAIVIQNKTSTTIIRAIFQNWISIFGCPRKILSDNGCEFNNQEFRELGEAFNIKILNTAAESPWSNGMCERQNAVIGDTVSKIISDVNCDVHVALSWAISARNALSNYSGFSPNQLVFGFNPALPNVFINEPPALEPIETSKMVRDNLQAMHAARESFIRVEASEKLTRALKHNIRATVADDIHGGDEVYYKRNDRKEWHGPGTVIGRDGKQFLVRHGGVYVRVHECRIKHLPNRNREGIIQEQTDDAEAKPVITNDDDSDDEQCAIDVSVDDLMQEEIPPLEDNEDQIVENIPPVVGHVEPEVTKLKVGHRIEGVETESGEYVSGKIVSRAGKSTGKFKNCFNVQKDNDNSVDWYNFDKDFNEWNIVPDDVEMLVLFNSDEVWSAKIKEIENWNDNEVYEEVNNIGQKVMSVRWVVTEKLKDGNRVVKARLVARGFEEDSSDLRKDSPTCSKESIRVAIAVAAANKWFCHSLDVKAAYLQGNSIERDVYLRPPSEFFTGKLWKLNKTVYGLCDAARAWYMRVRDELLKLGVYVSSLDSAIFCWKNNGILEGIICVYVDDFLWAGTEKFEVKIINALSDMFLIGSAESKSFKYVGLNVVSLDSGCITVDQSQYISALNGIVVSKERSSQKASDLSDKERADYRALIGQLNWVATHTRPDIAFDVCELSVSCKDAVIGDLMRLNKVVSRVTGDNVKLFFPRLNASAEWFLECYADASFGNLPGSGSQGGFIIFLRDDNGVRCPIAWQTKKIRRVVKSTLAAETLALLDCSEAAVFIVKLLSEIGVREQVNVKCYVDNKNLVESLYSSHYVEDRRLRIDIAVLQDMMKRREIHSVSWVDTKQQLADCLTKRGASAHSLKCAVSGS